MCVFAPLLLFMLRAAIERRLSRDPGGPGGGVAGGSLSLNRKVT